MALVSLLIGFGGELAGKGIALNFAASRNAAEHQASVKINRFQIYKNICCVHEFLLLLTLHKIVHTFAYES